MDLQTQITIEWTFDDNQNSMQTWHKWQPSRTLSPHPLEERLFWPNGTICILESAFQMRLDRKTGWDLSLVEQSHKEAYLTAAAVYRRGVSIKDRVPRPKSGLYSIDIIEDSSPPIEPTARRIYLVDNNVARAHQLPKGKHVKTFSIEEEDKTLQKLADIMDFLNIIDNGDVAYTIVGGGVFCDVAAFALSLKKRPFTLIPTTLLSMIDASVGGKTGVNFPPYGKNQIGLFSFPSRVIIWPQWLQTLDRRHVKAGHAECFKHALINGNRNLLDKLSDDLYLSDYQKIIKPLIDVKAGVISKDPNEKGERAVLNLGHTLAHALEKISHEQSDTIIAHGEAVGIGLVFALKLSAKVAGFDPSAATKLIKGLKQSKCLLTKKELKIYLNETDLSEPTVFEKLKHAMMQDKKNQNDQIRWVLLKNPGEIFQPEKSFTVAVEHSTLDEVWLDCLKEL